MAHRKTRSESILCPAVGFQRIVGGKYKLRVLWAVSQRPRRYTEIHASLLKGSLGRPVTARVLSRELKELQQRGLIRRALLDGTTRRVEYSMTERGRTLVPVLEAIVEWGLSGVPAEILGLEGAAP